MPMTNIPQEDLVAPSVPTGVRIDSNKVMQWMNDLVRFTEGFTVEKLERIYTAMAKVNFQLILLFAITFIKLGNPPLQNSDRPYGLAY